MKKKTHTHIYVQPDGSDENAGTAVAPFRTLERALRELGRSPTSVTIILREGRYDLDRGLVLETKVHTDTRYRICGEGEVIITGSRGIEHPVPVEDGKIRERLPSPDKVLSIDLRSQGIDDFGTVTDRGNPGLELFYGSRRLELARYPREGWLEIAEVPQLDGEPYHKGLSREKRYDGVPVGRHYGCFCYPGDRPSAWRNHSNILLQGYWTWDWNDAMQQIERLDLETRTIYPRRPYHNYGYTKKQRFCFLNILEELDRPGLWCLDREDGMAYFWPPEEAPDQAYSVSLVEEPLIEIRNSANVSVENIEFSRSRGNGVVINGGNGNRVAGCRFHSLGSDAILISGTDNGALSNDFSDLSAGGIRIEGGDRTTLTPGNNYARNNQIHHFSTWIRTYQYGICVDGVGHAVCNNLIYDAPHEGMRFKGNDHLFEYNELHHLCYETGDSGAIHTGRDWSWRGTVLRYNYIHHLSGPGLHGLTALYLDDFQCGVTMFGNILYRVGTGVQIGGGRDNIVENNIFVECEPSVHVDARGTSWAAYYFDGSYPWLFEKFSEVKADKPPYTERYPELSVLLDDDPAFPKGNRLIRNISVGGRWLDIHDRVLLGDLDVRDNLIYGPDLGWRFESDSEGIDPYYLNLKDRSRHRLLHPGDPPWSDELESKDNLISSEITGFEKWLSGDFSTIPDGDERTIGFTPIDFARIGLYPDEFRTVAPGVEGPF